MVLKFSKFSIENVISEFDFERTPVLSRLLLLSLQILQCLATIRRLLIVILGILGSLVVWLLLPLVTTAVLLTGSMLRGWPTHLIISIELLSVRMLKWRGSTLYRRWSATWPKRVLSVIAWRRAALVMSLIRWWTSLVLGRRALAAVIAIIRLEMLRRVLLLILVASCIVVGRWSLIVRRSLPGLGMLQGRILLLLVATIVLLLLIVLTGRWLVIVLSTVVLLLIVVLVGIHFFDS